MAKLWAQLGTNNTINTPSFVPTDRRGSYLHTKIIRIYPCIELLEVCVRWYYRLFQHQDRLNHPCNSTGTFKVSNVTLDSPTKLLVSIT